MPAVMILPVAVAILPVAMTTATVAMTMPNRPQTTKLSVYVAKWPMLRATRNYAQPVMA